MPKICSAGGCTNHHLQREKKLSFYRFPRAERDPERRSRWARACNRRNPNGTDWIPTSKYVYMCSEHFLTGKPNPDPNHPDYVPSVFKKVLTPRTLRKGNKKVERFNSAKRRRLFQSSPNQRVDQNNHQCTVDSLSEKPTNSAKEDCEGPVDSLSEKPTNSAKEDCEGPVDSLSEKPTNSANSTNSAKEDCEGPEYTAVRLNEHESWKQAGFRRCIEQTEREQFQIEINNLRSERDALIRQIEELNNRKFGAHIVEDDDEKCKFYTGVSWLVFVKIFEFLSQFLPPAKPRSLTLRDQFFATLVKLRQNPNFDYLADQLGVGHTTVKDIFWKWVQLIESKLKFYDSVT